MSLKTKITFSDVPWKKYRAAIAFPKNCFDCSSCHAFASYMIISIPLTEIKYIFFNYIYFNFNIGKNMSIINYL